MSKQAKKTEADTADHVAERLNGLSAAEYIELALAALDQADVTPSQLADAYRHARGDVARTLNELEIVTISEEAVS